MPGTLGTIAEVFIWLGCSVGMLLLLTSWIMRAVRGPWAPITAVAVDGEVRWMTDAGDFRSRQLSAHEAEVIGDDDQHEFHSRRSQRSVHLEPVAHDERLILVLGLVFLAVGVIAFLASFAVLFL